MRNYVYWVPQKLDKLVFDGVIRRTSCLIVGEAISLPLGNVF